MHLALPQPCTNTARVHWPFSDVTQSNTRLCHQCCKTVEAIAFAKVDCSHWWLLKVIRGFLLCCLANASGLHGLCRTWQACFGHYCCAHTSAQASCHVHQAQSRKLPTLSSCVLALDACVSTGMLTSSSPGSGVTTLWLLTSSLNTSSQSSAVTSLCDTTQIWRSCPPTFK